MRITLLINNPPPDGEKKVVGTASTTFAASFKNQITPLPYFIRYHGEWSNVSIVDYIDTYTGGNRQYPVKRDEKIGYSGVVGELLQPVLYNSSNIEQKIIEKKDCQETVFFLLKVFLLLLSLILLPVDFFLILTRVNFY